MSQDDRPPASLRFPITLGCVDAGSNGVRMAVARFKDPNDFELVEYERASVRLGHEVFLSGRLSASTIDSAIAAFRSFRARFEALGVARWRCVATSAVREASNGPAFLERVHEECGLDLEIITGSEEARLVHLAVSKKVALGDTMWLLVDVGGGSVEISLVDADGIRWIESHTMGSVRLLEELTSSGEDPSRFLQLLEEYASTLRIPATTSDRPVGYIATGGNIESLARLAGATLDPKAVSRLAMADLRNLIERLSRMSYHQRVTELGLRPDRADVILPAGIVYERLGHLIGVREIVVPNVGVKDGILHDLASEMVPEAAQTRHDRQVEQAALILGRKYHFDEAHGRHVAMLALSLFDQLRSLHGLDRQSRRILHAAAILHEIGSYVSNSGHHRHSMYLIAASGPSALVGFSPEEIDVIANVARYHRKAPPKPEHEAYQRLAKTDRLRVSKLGALLRVADALDRDHAQLVTSVLVREEKGLVRLFVQSKGGLLLEAWSLKERSDLFRIVFDKKVVLEGAG
jgi:exopolyphosphatase/guanosine-5'-triphosphate,3'-diphosphate pyrophosphatase